MLALSVEAGPLHLQCWCPGWGSGSGSASPSYGKFLPGVSSLTDPSLKDRHLLPPTCLAAAGPLLAPGVERHVKAGDVDIVEQFGGVGGPGDIVIFGHDVQDTVHGVGI